MTSTYKPNLPNQWDKLYSILEHHIKTYQLNDTFQEALSNRIALSTLFLGLNEMECKESHKKKIQNYTYRF